MTVVKKSVSTPKRVCNHDYCLRAKESLETEKGFDSRALHWRDVYFKDGFDTVEGEAVADSNRVTLCVLSSKNKLIRCSRSTIEVPGVDTNAVTRLKALYLRILREEGSVDPNAPVFRLRNGKVVSRQRIFHDSSYHHDVCRSSSQSGWKPLAAAWWSFDVSSSQSARRGHQEVWEMEQRCLQALHSCGVYGNGPMGRGGEPPGTTVRTQLSRWTVDESRHFCG